MLISLSLRHRYGFALICLALLAGLWLNPAFAGSSTRPINFPNNTGKDANDLHIEFVQGVTPQPPAGPYGPFLGQSGSGGNKIDFNNGQVKNGQSAQITFTSTSPKITVKQWWWTLNGKRIGRIMKERHLGMVTFDQVKIKPGEIVSVELYAAADLNKLDQFKVSYSVTTPDGNTIPLPDVEVSVEAGEESHQQLWAVALDQLGTYTLRYSVIDLSDGLEVSEGESTVTVDEGRAILPDPVQEDPTE